MIDSVQREDAILAAQKLAESLTRSVRLRRARQTANQPLIEWLARLLEERLDEGSFLTPLLHLPQALQPPVLEAVKGEGVYSTRPLGVVLKIKNVSPRICRILVDEIHHSNPVQVNTIGYVDGDTGWWQDVHHDLRPGEEIDLAPHYAILALQDHSQSGFQPHLWGGSGAIPEQDDLVEVGFRATVGGREIRSKRRKGKAA